MLDLCHFGLLTWGCANWRWVWSSSLKTWTLARWVKLAGYFGTQFLRFHRLAAQIFDVSTT